MGNHEYCTLCEEDDHHYSRPCDPAKAAAVAEKNARRAERKRKAVERMREFAKTQGWQWYYINDGSLSVPWDQFSHEDD